MSLLHALGAVVERNTSKIREINRRYAKPRLSMSPAVRFTLAFLRIYLIVLLGLLVVKFCTVVSQ